MSTIIQIKRNAGTTAPTTSDLVIGEMAYAYDASGDGASGKLYIEAVNSSSAADIHIIGGKYYTDLLDHTLGATTASSALLVDSNSKLDVINIDNVTVNGNDISTTDSNGNLTFTPNGTGNVVANTDTLQITSATSEAALLLVTGGEGATAGIQLQADDSDDAGDDWFITSNTSNTLTIGNDAASAGTSVAHVTITPHGTVASSTFALAGKLTVAGTTTFAGAVNMGSQATTNVNIDSGVIDGATVGANSASTGAFTTLSATGASTFTNTVTVGVDNTGHDVKLFGDTAGSFLLWDESDDALELTDSSPIKIGDGGDMQIYHDGSHSYITNATGALKLATETSGIAVTIGHTTSETTVADNLTVTGNLTVSGTQTTGATSFGDGDITNVGDIQLDSLTGDGDTNTKITFSGSDVITITAAGAAQVTFTDGAIIPSSDDDIDLGTNLVRFKNAYFDGTVTSDAFAGPLTGDVTGNVSGTAATVTTAAQGSITSLGTLTALTVDDINLNGKLITMTGSSGDTAVLTAGTNGTLDITTTDAAAAAANIQITADGTAELAGTTVTLDSGGGITLDADNGTITFADGGASLGTITSSGYTGNVVGNVTGNTSGTALTVTQAAQTAITSLGTLTALTVDNLTINGNTITADSGALNLTPAGGSAIVLDSTINVDAGVVTGATSITSTAFVGNITGNVTGNTSGTALTVTQAAQGSITSLGTLTTLTVDDLTINGQTISTTASNKNIILAPHGTGDVAITSDTLSVTGTEGESASLMLIADESDDASDDWTITANTGGTLTFGNDIASAGTAVAHLTITPHATVASSTIATAGHLTVAGNLTVSGTTTTVSSTVTTIADPLIELATGTSGTPSNDVGHVFERGDSDNIFIGWDESADVFIAATGSFTGASTGNLSITPAAAKFGSLTLTTDLAVAEGGTGVSTFADKGIVYGDGSSALDVTAAPGGADVTASFQILTCGSSNGNPVWTTTIDGGTY